MLPRPRTLIIKNRADSLGHVTGGHNYFSDQTPVAGQQFDYTFDTIGNRSQTLAGGDFEFAGLADVE